MRWILLYDKECFVCRKTAGFLALLDRQNLIDRIDYHLYYEQNQLHIPITALEKEIHLISLEGDLFSGHLAIQKVITLLYPRPFFRWLLNHPLSTWWLSVLYRLATLLRKNCSTCSKKE